MTSLPRMHSVVRSITLATLLAFPLAASAETMTATDAGTLEKQLTALLPDSLVKDGAFKLRPSGDGYEMRFDLRNGIARAVAPWTVSEVTPVVQTLISGEDGLWEIGGKGAFKLATEFAAANRSNSFQLAIAGYDSKATFDPGIGFLRNAELGLKDILIGMRSSQDSIKIGMKDLTVNMGIADRQPGIGDLTADFSVSSLAETFGAFPNPEVKLDGETLAGRVTAEGIDFAGIRKLVAFWQGPARGKQVADLGQSERTALAAIVAEHKPFVARAGGRADVANVSFLSGGKRFTIGTLGYRWSFDLAGDGAMAAGLAIDNPKVDPGVWPAGLEQAMPTSIALNIRYHGFKLGPMWDLLSDPRTIGDASKRSPDELSAALLPDGRVVVEFSDTYVRSAHYELSLGGKLYMRPGKRDDQTEADLDITARDFEKTIKFLQDNAKTVPLFGRAAFFALMAKGMGKALPDGSMVWNVKMDGMGKITINGQPLPV